MTEKRPWIIAHRGSPRRAPENTLASFRLAIEEGADMVELDAQLSADGAVVVIHDATVDRTTDGSGAVSGLTAAALKELDAGSWFGAEWRGERIPLLAEAVAAAADQCRMNIELKSSPQQREALVDAVADVLRRSGRPPDRFLVTSFDLHAVGRWEKVFPEVPCGVIVHDHTGEMDRLPGSAIHPHAFATTRALVERAHAAGKRVHPWTVSDEASVRRLLECGVDGFITMDPAGLRRFLEA